MKIIKIENSNNNLEKCVIEFLKKIDSLFKIPLSQKIDLEEYSKKIVRNADVFLALDNESIVGIVVGYNNDKEFKISNMSILAVLNEYQGKGVARRLVNNFLDLAKNKKMEKVKLSTVDARALKLYESLNFKIVREENEVYYLELKLK